MSQPVKCFYLFFRDDGIVFAVTFWQWIWEMIISAVVLSLQYNITEHRFLEHLLLLTLLFVSYVFFPSFCLMADCKFRRVVEEKGFIKAVLLAFTQKYE